LEFGIVQALPKKLLHGIGVVVLVVEFGRFLLPTPIDTGTIDDHVDVGLQFFQGCHYGIYTLLRTDIARQSSSQLDTW
jgi:hypothetical protein